MTITTSRTPVASVCPHSAGRGSCAGRPPDEEGAGRPACSTCGGVGYVVPAGCNGNLTHEGALVHGPPGPCLLHTMPTADYQPDGFGCPLPAYRMVENPEDPDGDRVPLLETCRAALTYEVTDGGTFDGDLDAFLCGPSWHIGCEAGHVLVVVDGEGDTPSSELVYTPDVALSALAVLTSAALEVR